MVEICSSFLLSRNRSSHTTIVLEAKRKSPIQLTRRIFRFFVWLKVLARPRRLSSRRRSPGIVHSPARSAVKPTPGRSPSLGICGKNVGSYPNTPVPTAENASSNAVAIRDTCSRNTSTRRVSMAAADASPTSSEWHQDQKVAFRF